MPAHAGFTSLSNKTLGETARSKPTWSCHTSSPTRSREWDLFPAATPAHIVCVRLFPEAGNLSAPLLFASQKSQRHPASTCTHVVSWWSARWLAHWAFSRGCASMWFPSRELSKPSHSATWACFNNFGRVQLLSGIWALLALRLLRYNFGNKCLHSILILILSVLLTVFSWHFFMVASGLQFPELPPALLGLQWGCSDTALVSLSANLPFFSFEVLWFTWERFCPLW